MTLQEKAPIDADAAAKLEALRRREPGAFEGLVREHGPHMLAVIRRYLQSDADANDALQDAFLSAFRGIGQFHGNSALGTWLHTIAVRSALMSLRTKRRLHEEGDIEALLPTYKPDGHRRVSPQSWSDRADRIAEREEDRALVRQSIDQLPEAYRVVLMMRDIDGLSTEEASEALGMNANALKTRLHRARQALRTVLDRHFGPASSK